MKWKSFVESLGLSLTPKAPQKLPSSKQNFSFISIPLEHLQPESQEIHSFLIIYSRVDALF